MTTDKARPLGPRLHRRTAILTDGFDPQLSVGSARPAVFEPFGITAVAIDAGDTAGLLDAIWTTPELELILIETPANPTLRVTDIAAAAVAAGSRERRPVVAVDNTFLGPAFQHPLTLGADLALYSATKYLAGFSDMLGGVVMARDPELDRRIRGARAVLGNILQPDECWLLTGRLPTVILRMRQQCAGAQQIVKRLNGHPAIQRLLYPTLIEDPEQRAIAASQSNAAGAIFSLQLHGGKAAAFEFLRTLKIIRDAVSLGGVESLACHPASTTHSELDADAQARSGVTPSLVRISVGLEDPRDLFEDDAWRSTPR